MEHKIKRTTHGEDDSSGISRIRWVGCAGRTQRQIIFWKQAQKTVAAKGKVRIAVSGGSTPKRTFALLANPQHKFLSAMPWAQLELYFVDERTVPPTDNDSNYRMTREAMLDKVPLKPEQVFRIEGELTRRKRPRATNRRFATSSSSKAQRFRALTCWVWAWATMGIRHRSFRIRQGFMNCVVLLTRIRSRKKIHGG